ncbi:hypothetical protein [Derxia lacustris]|uniref:hypothetical protein n=1 Tax=Derxia lacustris TaxID=764842 RepID=UPI00111C7B89|nr:hypothetical protein [Derxia lacustris]
MSRVSSFPSPAALETRKRRKSSRRRCSWRSQAGDENTIAQVKQAAIFLIAKKPGAPLVIPDGAQACDEQPACANSAHITVQAVPPTVSPSMRSVG